MCREDAVWTLCNLTESKLNQVNRHTKPAIMHSVYVLRTHMHPPTLRQTSIRAAHGMIHTVCNILYVLLLGEWVGRVLSLAPRGFVCPCLLRVVLFTLPTRPSEAYLRTYSRRWSGGFRAYSKCAVLLRVPRVYSGVLECM